MVAYQTIHRVCIHNQVSTLSANQYRTPSQEIHITVQKIEQSWKKSRVAGFVVHVTWNQSRARDIRGHHAQLEDRLFSRPCQVLVSRTIFFSRYDKGSNARVRTHRERYLFVNVLHCDASPRDSQQLCHIARPAEEQLPRSSWHIDGLQTCNSSRIVAYMDVLRRWARTFNNDAWPCLRALQGPVIITHWCERSMQYAVPGLWTGR
jgi:hypothetical protein